MSSMLYDAAGRLEQPATVVYKDNVGVSLSEGDGDKGSVID